MKLRLQQKKQHQINKLQQSNILLRKKLEEKEIKANLECIFIKSREHLRVWRNSNRLTRSWIYSILTEAEKSNVYARLKEANSIGKLIFQSEDLPPPAIYNAKGIPKPVQKEISTRVVSEHDFAESQVQEIYKFMTKLHTPNQ